MVAANTSEARHLARFERSPRLARHSLPNESLSVASPNTYASFGLSHAILPYGHFRPTRTRTLFPDLNGKQLRTTFERLLQPIKAAAAKLRTADFLINFRGRLTSKRDSTRRALNLRREWRKTKRIKNPEK